MSGRHAAGAGRWLITFLCTHRKQKEKRNRVQAIESQSLFPGRLLDWGSNSSRFHNLNWGPSSQICEPMRIFSFKQQPHRHETNYNAWKKFTDLQLRYQQTQWEKACVSKNSTGKIGYAYVKGFRPLKKYSKWIEQLNVIPETVLFPEVIIRKITPIIMDLVI